MLRILCMFWMQVTRYEWFHFISSICFLDPSLISRYFVENWTSLIIHVNSKNQILFPKVCYGCCLFSDFLICKVSVFVTCSHRSLCSFAQRFDGDFKRLESMSSTFFEGLCWGEGTCLPLGQVVYHSALAFTSCLCRIKVNQKWEHRASWGFSWSSGMYRSFSKPPVVLLLPSSSSCLPSSCVFHWYHCLGHLQCSVVVTDCFRQTPIKQGAPHGPNSEFNQRPAH